MNIPTISPENKVKQKIEVWISPNDEIFEAIPLFPRFSRSVGNETKYSFEILIQKDKPVAYAIFHPDMSKRYILIDANLIRKQSAYLSEL